MPGMSPALMKAIQTIQQELGKYESNAMGGKGGQVVEIEVEPSATHLAEGEDDGGEECADCAAGTCDNPDHVPDEEYDQMMT